MTHEGLAVLIIVAGVIGLAALAFIAWLVYDVGRMTRAVAGLVYQEEEKTRSLFEKLRRQPSGE